MAVMKAGLLGLGRGGQQLAEALLRSGWCELVSVASLRPERLDLFTRAHPGVAGFNDYRLAVISKPVDVLFVAVPPFHRPDYLRLAADRQVPVWMLSPPLSRYDQLVETVELFERASVPIVAARTWGAESSLRPQAVALDDLGQFFMAEGHVGTCWDGDLSWRGDSARGGGVLLDRAYHLLDAIVQLMGPPASVLATMGRTPVTRSRTVYDTEDSAAVVCRYAEGGIATLTACRTSGPEQWSLCVRGTGGSLNIEGLDVVVRDRAGQQEILRQKRSANPLIEQVDEFLATLQSNPRKLIRSLREHLPTMAAMQAAYLSARTGHPETPAIISRMHRVK